MISIPVELQEALKRRECVLFVGAGLSEGLPNWKELMNPLAKELGIKNDEDPCYIAEYYENTFDRSRLEEKIVSQLQKEVPLTKTHQLLAELPFKAIVTTNYDHLLEKALSQKEFITVITEEEAPLARSDQLPLVKMHGDISIPSTMVITKTDYDEYLERHRGLITYVLSLLITCNFLFVGFGLKDPNFDNVYAQIKSLFKDTYRKGFAIVKDPSDFEVKRLEKTGINVIAIKDYSEIPNFFEELTIRCTDKPQKPAEVPFHQVGNVQKTFCKVVERQHEWLDPRSIFQFEKMLTKKEVVLETVYIVPRLVKQERIRKRIQKRDIDREKEFTDTDAYEPLKREKPSKYIFERKVELTLKEALSDANNKHMVILGEPGMGKSCLLKNIALKASVHGESVGKKVLPVLIPLREYPKFCKGEMFKEFVFHYINAQICSLPKNVFEHFLEKNAFFFLLDGLDEVVKESERIDISRQVERFMAQYPDTKIILTSRPAGYNPAALIGAVPHFTLAAFNDEEITAFLVKWFTFLDKVKEERFDQDAAERKAQTLFSIIKKEERILHLARNPLLLTILALIHRVGKKLPEKRAGFYDMAVRTIAASWDAWKDLQIEKERELFDQDTILAILEKIGFRLHSEKQENVVTIEELKEWLKEAMEEEKGRSSPKKINDFVWMLNQRAGLLVERRSGLYGFVHLTFQEYFAARYIAGGQGVKLAQDLIRENVYAGRWREVFLLAAAIASPEQANLILDSCLEAENPFEEYIHSNLLMAGLMLADLPRVKPSKREDIVSKLISLCSPKNVDLLRVDALEVLTEIGRTSFIEDNSWALTLLHDNDWRVRQQAVTYVTTISADDTTIKGKIFILLSDKDWDVRQQAVTYFTTIGADDTTIKEKIFTLLHDKDWDVRQQAVTYVTTISANDTTIKGKFFTLLHDKYWDVRQQAVTYFTTISADDTTIKEKFFTLLSDKDWHVRQQAVTYFTTISADDTTIKEKIFTLLHDKYWHVRQQAVEYLSRYAREESSKKAPTLFKSKDESIKREVYRLMKAILQTKEMP